MKNNSSKKMWKIFILESNGKPATEFNYFKGLKRQLENFEIKNIFSRTEYLSPYNDKICISKIEEAKTNNSIVFLLADNENYKIENINNIVNECKKDIKNTNNFKIIFLTKDSPQDYTFEVFLSYHSEPPEPIKDNSHKRDDKIFQTMAKKWHKNILKIRSGTKHLYNLFENLSKEKYIGQLFKELLELDQIKKLKES